MPAFDVPRDEGGPSVTHIVNRIKCELIALVKPDAFTRAELVQNNFEVGLQLSLDVNSSGELAPSFNFPQTAAYAFNFGLKYSRAHQQNFTVNLYYSMPVLAKQWDLAIADAKAKGLSEPDVFGKCPSPLETNLTGNLGIKESVELAFTAPDRAQQAKLQNNAGQFGGFVSFVVTKNVNSVGPTWTLVHFKGPGNLGTFGIVNTDKITFGFAAGGPDGSKFPDKPSDKVRDLLLQLNISQIQAR
ncbi:MULTISPECIES: hypothetical protein [unclassified Mesorhizobium]|uniref:hypothetical protein n=1 Tax=unclassified Mesorhizobium TaxID=325217 RepID=UPI0003D03A28|nr:hypothetical protein [Mesorhizobium sp. L103C131B0]ESZ64762.1 hypothetical protein X729_05595 [Mesorhizobium sp. L103C131B0]